MGMCPICNGLQSLNLSCEKCKQELIDYGKVMDYYGKYEAYMPIDLNKLNNGINNDLADELCPHYIICSQCGEESVYLVQEE
ncbi:hypothetical protein [Halalkalibacter akibai]|uniref:Uncharacterized protein n=1 Tax=Halalkalibacter akibai (strain ATCC 43226 / DSM 21942 / CIP 109018 / JCM 9157 / 1139) TaxID=1236973 RepID=W4QU13_HALA3|nr:hypothetical protein [Halalkalibacter akibai]GAE35655.1 hypothetical protein JCM9157_2772 [Halalkalibacter akibai JCM 9157]